MNMMTISTTSSSIPINSSNAFLFGFILEVVKDRPQWHQRDLLQNEFMTKNNTESPMIVSPTEIDEQTDGELIHLLMPIWAYQSAAAYLIFVSVLGLFMNIIVVIVIINDPQVGLFDSNSYSESTGLWKL
jgi:hypothetical protein